MPSSARVVDGITLPAYPDVSRFVSSISNNALRSRVAALHTALCYPPSSSEASSLPSSGSSAALTALYALRADLPLSSVGGTGRKALETLLVAALGYADPLVRDEAVVLLNVLYDGHGLQMTDALPVTIATVGDRPSFRHALPHFSSSNSTAYEAVRAITTESIMKGGQKNGAPAMPVLRNPSALAVKVYAWEAGAVRERTLPAELQNDSIGATVIHVDFFEFVKPGYYDWVVVSSDARDARVLETRRIAGRFVVQKKSARTDFIVEVPVDEVGATWDEHTGLLRNRGSFEAVASSLPELKRSGATAIYLMGALERPHEEDISATPFVVARRDAPAHVLGGHTAFESLLSEVVRHGMTPIVDAIDRVSKARGHRQYAGMHCSIVGPNGYLIPHPGTDGRENQWEETVLLNYRSINVWERYIADVKELANRYGIRGVRLDNAQSAPPIMELDESELYRLDVDGEFHYAERDRLFGSVVKANLEGGYWTSDAANFRGYPNPFLVKFCKEMWTSYSDFIIIAESHFYREPQLAASGCIPHSIRVPQILSSINGKSLRRDGSLVRLPENRRSTAKTLSRLYKSDRYAMPKNTLMLGCSCSHLSPYPALLYGRRSWLAVDLLFFLPHVPMLLLGEDAGKAYRHNMAAVVENVEFSEHDVHFDAVLPKSPKKKSRGISPKNGTLQYSQAPPKLSFGNLPPTGCYPSADATGHVESISLDNLHSQDMFSDVSGEALSSPIPALSSTASKSECLYGGGEATGSIAGDVDKDVVKATDSLHEKCDVNFGIENPIQGLAMGIGNLANMLNSQMISNASSDKKSSTKPPNANGSTIPESVVTAFSSSKFPGISNDKRDFEGAPPSNGATPSSRLGKAGLSRRGSMSSLGLKRSSPKNGRSGMVRSMSRDDMRGLSIRNMSSEELQKLSALETAARAEIGPETGYDLSQIKAHYAHRNLLRQEHAVLHRGSFCVLSPDPQSKDSIFAFARFTDTDLVIVAANFRDTRDGAQFVGGVSVELDLRVLWEDDIGLHSSMASNFDRLYKFVNMFTGSDYLPREYFTLEEIVFRKLSLHIPPLGIVVLKVVPVATAGEENDESSQLYDEHFLQCLTRLQENDASNSLKDARENHAIASIARAASSSLAEFGKTLERVRAGLFSEGCDGETVHNILQLCLQRASALLPSIVYEHVAAPKDFVAPSGERISAYLSLLSTVSTSADLCKASRVLLKRGGKIGPLVFLTAELGRFSTAGGLGVMVDELTKGLVALGLEVYVVSPYYAVNRKNQADYLGDDIKWTRNISINIGTGLVDVGVFEGVEHGVNLIFLERKDYFSKVYANPGTATRHLQTVILMSLGSLEVFCQKALKPAMVVTNDWLPSMAAGYARNGHFGDYFNQTTFMHLIHNLGDLTYEGRCFPEREGDDMGYIHRLPRHLVVDPLWSRTIANPSRTALLCSDSWGTVSPSYMKELLSGHDLSPLLQLARRPFAYPNGIPMVERQRTLLSTGASDHTTGKFMLQQRYFNMRVPDRSIPLFAFVGRVTAQKGVHLILNAVDELVRYTDGKIQILVGGPANYQDKYAAGCAHHMHELRNRHPDCFWAAPEEFFTDGPLVNLGADFGIMPSLFEPGGIVQQEFFVAGTPVVAFKTGGLKDTVHEWQVEECDGNGFVFEEYTHQDFVYAVKRALHVFAHHEEYAELRLSAYTTTIDVAQVAYAWSSEFHRMRNVILRNPRDEVLQSEYYRYIQSDMELAVSAGLLDKSSRLVEIAWSGEVPPSEKVCVKGSWDDWAVDHLLRPVSRDSNVRGVQLLLSKGEYTYKFRIGKKWIHAEDRVMREETGPICTINNVLVVE